MVPKVDELQPFDVHPCSAAQSHALSSAPSHDGPTWHPAPLASPRPTPRDLRSISSTPRRVGPAAPFTSTRPAAWDPRSSSSRLHPARAWRGPSPALAQEARRSGPPKPHAQGQHPTPIPPTPRPARHVTLSSWHMQSDSSPRATGGRRVGGRECVLPMVRPIRCTPGVRGACHSPLVRLRAQARPASRCPVSNDRTAEAGGAGRREGHLTGTSSGNVEPTGLETGLGSGGTGPPDVGSGG